MSNKKSVREGWGGKVEVMVILEEEEGLKGFFQICVHNLKEQLNSSCLPSAKLFNT